MMDDYTMMINNCNNHSKGDQVVVGVANLFVPHFSPWVRDLTVRAMVVFVHTRLYE